MLCKSYYCLCKPCIINSVPYSRNWCKLQILESHGPRSSGEREGRGVGGWRRGRCQDASLRAGAGRDFGRFRKRRKEAGKVRAGWGWAWIEYKTKIRIPRCQNYHKVSWGVLPCSVCVKQPLWMYFHILDIIRSLFTVPLSVSTSYNQGYNILVFCFRIEYFKIR